jgi:uncharacterized membrane protein
MIAAKEIPVRPPETMALITWVLPVVTIAISTPLVLRKVPPNVWYGFRTRKTLSDTNLWYEANYRGGVNLIIASIIALIARMIFMQMFEPELAGFVSMAVLAVVTVGAAIISVRQVRGF